MTHSHSLTQNVVEVTDITIFFFSVQIREEQEERGLKGQEQEEGKELTFESQKYCGVADLKKNAQHEICYLSFTGAKCGQQPKRQHLK